MSPASQGSQPSGALAALAEMLATDVADLSFLHGYDDGRLQRLAAIVGEAAARQDAAVSRALDGALGIVPRPLRGRARAVLFPGGDR